MQYSSPKFVEVESTSNGFFINTANFFLSNMLLTIGMFLVCRFLFFLLFRFRISVLFREFSFWPYLAIILMEGNLQFASYLVAFEFRWMFATTLANKLMTSWLVCVFYLILAFSVGSYFLFRYVYGELAKYFFDNSVNSTQGAFYLMVNGGLRNILLGFAHATDFT